MRTLILILWSTLFSFGQGQAIEINYESDLKDYDLLKGRLDNYRIFFDGETHNISSNETRHFNLFKFLYHNYGVRYFIQEYGSQWGFYVNKYLQTGDFTWIESRISSKESGELYRQLYQFNNSLPIDDRILFLSIDAYGFVNAEEYLNHLSSDKGEPSTSVRKVLDILKTIKRENSRFSGMDIRGKDKNNILGKLKVARGLVLSEQTEFMKYFGDDYIFFHLLVFNHASEKRSDLNLEANFMEFSKFHNNGNYYLFYGNLHCQLKPSWLAGRLNNNSQFKDQVCSFTSQYQDSEFLFFQKKADSDTWTYEPRKLENFGILDDSPNKKEIIKKLSIESFSECTLYSASSIGQRLEKVTNFLFFLKNQTAAETYYGKE